MSYTSQRIEIVEYGHLLYEKDLTSGTGGNLSIHVKNKLLITPSGESLGFLYKDGLVVIDKKGEKISGYADPSSEKLMHIFVYKNRRDIRACCHAHPPCATAFSVTGQKLQSDILPETILILGEIAITDYAPPGTDAVPKALEKFIADHDVFILKNHGVLTLGRNMEEAYFRMETVEHLAKITYIAQSLGKINLLEKNEVARLNEIRRNNGMGNKQ
jgi:L-fuculose-phosphate aldolase